MIDSELSPGSQLRWTTRKSLTMFIISCVLAGIWLLPTIPSSFVPTDDMLIERDGKKVWEHRYENGMLKFRSEWKWDDSLARPRYVNHGLEEEWYPSGQQWLYTEWQDGVRHGEYIRWDGDGN